MEEYIIAKIYSFKPGVIKLLRLFQICFYTGVIFTIASFLLGQLFDFLNFDGDLDMDGDMFGTALSPLKPIIIVSFITTLGGVGIIVTNKGYKAITAFIIAFVTATTVSFLLHKFIVTPLYKAQNTSAVSQEELKGYTAKIRVSIVENSFGSITYVVNGNTYSAPAKSIDGIDIYQGEEVRIVNIESNIFYVDRV